MTTAVITEPARFELKIKTPHEIFDMPCVCHRTTDSSERCIESDFYAESGDGVPQGVHHEMELMRGPWDRDNIPPLHIHTSKKNDVRYVCWTGSLPDIDTALVLYKRWAVGTSYTICTGKLLEDLIRRCNRDWDTIFSVLKEEFGIEIISENVIE